MLRGGILYVKIQKDLDLDANNKDEPPGSARQVRV